jgi:hypothetical protein
MGKEITTYDKEQGIFFSSYRKGGCSPPKRWMLPWEISTTYLLPRKIRKSIQPGETGKKEDEKMKKEKSPKPKIWFEGRLVRETCHVCGTPMPFFPKCFRCGYGIEITKEEIAEK